MKLAAYIRVSTDRQAEQGFGLPIQQETISRWARNNGHTIVSWHEDAGESGSNGIAQRHGLADALHACANRTARGIIVARLDRLARDLVLQETLLAEVRKHHARVWSCADGEDAYLADDPTDPSRKLIRQILGAVAEYERAMIALRMTAGRERKRAQGGYASGAPPYGYRAVDGKLVAHPIELTQIELMRSLRASGASYGHVAQILERTDVPPPKGGTRWHPNTVRRILERADAA